MCLDYIAMTVAGKSKPERIVLADAIINFNIAREVLVKDRDKFP